MFGIPLGETDRCALSLEGQLPPRTYTAIGDIFRPVIDDTAHVILVSLRERMNAWVNARQAVPEYVLKLRTKFTGTGYCRTSDVGLARSLGIEASPRGSVPESEADEAFAAYKILLETGVLGAHSPSPGQDSVVSIAQVLDYLDQMPLDQTRFDLIEARPVDPLETGLRIETAMLFPANVVAENKGVLAQNSRALAYQTNAKTACHCKASPA